MVTGAAGGVRSPIPRAVFVLTHHGREPIEMAGGTTFHFVTQGLEHALALAREAGGGDVDLAGGASTVRQALSSGEVDELTLDIAPLLLGSGERLFDGDVNISLEPLEAEHSAAATHVRYRVRR